MHIILYNSSNSLTVILKMSILMWDTFSIFNNSFGTFKMLNGNVIIGNSIIVMKLEE